MKTGIYWYSTTEKKKTEELLEIAAARYWGAAEKERTGGWSGQPEENLVLLTRPAKNFLFLTAGTGGYARWRIVR